MKQRRTEDEPKKEGAKTPFFVFMRQTLFRHLTKGKQRKKSRSEAAESAPESKKERSKYCGIFFFAKQVVLLCTQKVLPLGGDELRANSEKRHKKPPGLFLAVFSAFCVAGGLVAHLGRMKGTTGLKTAFSGIVGFYITTAKQLKNKF